MSPAWMPHEEDVQVRVPGRSVAEAGDDHRRLLRERRQLLVDLLVEDARGDRPLVRTADVEIVVDHRLHAGSRERRPGLVGTKGDPSGRISKQWHGFDVE